MGMLAIPVCVNALIVPDGGCLRVTAIAWFSCVVGWVEKERFHWEGYQVPLLKVSQVLFPGNKDIIWFDVMIIIELQSDSQILMNTLIPYQIPIHTLNPMQALIYYPDSQPKSSVNTLISTEDPHLQTHSYPRSPSIQRFLPQIPKIISYSSILWFPSLITFNTMIPIPILVLYQILRTISSQIFSSPNPDPHLGYPSIL